MKNALLIHTKVSKTAHNVSLKNAMSITMLLEMDTIAYRRHVSILNLSIYSVSAKIVRDIPIETMITAIDVPQI